MQTKMRIIGAYMLCVLAGNESPGADDIKKILDSIGEKPDEERLELFLSQVKGKDLAEVIEAGSKKLGAVPSAAGGAGAGAGEAGGAAEEKKEEKKEEEEDDIIDFSDDDDE
ncbi:hypothetical protein AAMO2058_000351700 [Amorphochlora amoebiformis]